MLHGAVRTPFTTDQSVVGVMCGRAAAGPQKHVNADATRRSRRALTNAVNFRNVVSIVAGRAMTVSAAAMVPFLRGSSVTLSICGRRAPPPPAPSTGVIQSANFSGVS